MFKMQQTMLILPLIYSGKSKQRRDKHRRFINGLSESGLMIVTFVLLDSN